MDESNIKIGVPAQIIPPIEKNLEITKKIEEYGYDSMWYPDHLMGWIPDSIWTEDLVPLAKYQKSPHIYLETFSLIAAHSVITKKIKMGIAVSETLRRHPAQMAQIMLTLDQLSKGRVIFGIGAGEAENTIPYGIDYSKPVSKLEENLRIIRLFMNNPHKKVNYEGKFWKINDAVIGLEPYNNITPPIWIGAHGPRMLEITAELADGWIPVNPPIDEYKQKLNIIINHAKKIGRDISNFTPAIYFYTVLTKDHNTCHEVMNTPLAKAWTLTAFDSFFTKHGHKHPLSEVLNKDKINPLTDYIPTRLSRKDALNCINNIPFSVIEDFFFHGNADDAIHLIENYSKIGCKYFVLWNFTGMFALEKYKESNEVLLQVFDYFKNS